MDQNQMLNILFGPESDVETWIEPGAMLHEGFVPFWERACTVIAQNGQVLRIRMKAFEELNQIHQSGDRGREERSRAAYGKGFIQKNYVESSPKTVEIVADEPSGLFGMNASPDGYRHPNQKRTAVITQNQEQVEELLTLPLHPDQQMVVLSLDESGWLIERKPGDGCFLEPDFATRLIGGRKKQVSGAFAPSDPRKPVLRGGPVVSESPSPKEGDTVNALQRESGKHYSFKLGKLIAEGGEGAIHEVHNMPNSVAKIYFPHRRTLYREQKIDTFLRNREFMMDSRKHGICTPTLKLVDENGQFIGFIMDKASGETLDDRAFLPKPSYVKENEGWDRMTLIRLCQTILRSFAFLHDHQVLVGDINPYNILVESPDRVYFVDVDSYQIEQFPCEVGFQNFLPPELQQHHIPKEQRQHFDLRKPENEYFSIAILLFMILIPGKFPYSQSGQSDVLDNLVQMKFPYPYGDDEGENLPDGIWAYAWSHLSRQIQEDFYNTFSRGGKYASPAMRLNAEEWLGEFRHYHQTLGAMMKVDPMSNDIFPTRFNRKKNVEYAICQECGEEYPKAELTHGYCSHCLERVVRYTYCQDCGCRIPFTFGQMIEGKQPESFCESCRNERIEQNREYSVCQQCQQLFSFSDEELEKAAKGIAPLPVICPDCRKEMERAAREPEEPVTLDLVSYLRKSMKSRSN